MNTTVTTPALLKTADLLLANPPTELAVTWRRGAAFALRAALESSITGFLSASRPQAEARSMKALLLCLRAYTDPDTARRAHTAWRTLCLGCHYRQYDPGPTEEQLSAWRTEVGELVTLLDN